MELRRRPAVLYGLRASWRGFLCAQRPVLFTASRARFLSAVCAALNALANGDEALCTILCADERVYRRGIYAESPPLRNDARTFNWSIGRKIGFALGTAGRESLRRNAVCVYAVVARRSPRELFSGTQRLEHAWPLILRCDADHAVNV